MRTSLKWTIVLGGYLLAWLLASGLVYPRIQATSGPDAQASSGMYAFGDFILFVWVFGLAALLPTLLGLYFPRPVAWFWRWASYLALGIVSTGVFFMLALYVGRSAPSQSTAGILAALSVLRALPSPPLALGFLLATLAAPPDAPAGCLGPRP